MDFVKHHTRQLAKRQLTWLRATPAIAFDPESPQVADEVTKLVAAYRVDGIDRSRR